LSSRFAAALDRCDFDEAARFIAVECPYELGEELLVGPHDIIASYRASAKWAARMLDRVTYGSCVRKAPAVSSSIECNPWRLQGFSPCPPAPKAVGCALCQVSILLVRSIR
jgi:hypothetical protein